MSSDAAIRLRDLVKRYPPPGSPWARLRAALAGAAVPEGEGFEALRGVSFDVARGETVGIVGRNGAGKSTLLGLVCGTLAPSGGEVAVAGRVSALLELGSSLQPEYSGRENIRLGVVSLGLTRREAVARLDGIAAFADLGAFLDRPLRTYSSGMAMRLAFAIAVHADPDVLVIDEALAVGDLEFQAKCFARLRELRARGVAILLVSHNLAAVRSFCDRAIWLERGRVAFEGPAGEACRRYELETIRGRFAAGGGSMPVEAAGGGESPAAGGPAEVALPHLRVASEAFLARPREGSGAIVIESALLTDDGGRPLETAGPESPVAFRALLRLGRDLDADFHLSVRIYDREGTPWTVVRDSRFEAPVRGRAGERLVASLPCRLPMQAGAFHAEIAVMIFPRGGKYPQGRFDFEAAEIGDLIPRAVHFRVAPFDRHPIPAPVLLESRLELVAVSEAATVAAGGRS